jgi:ADP-heptose:LPS heptosyltransferase
MAGITATIWLRERYQRLYGKVRVAVEVLIIRLSALGDVVHALPVAALLKRQIPGARITWIVEPAAAQLLQDNEAVDEVLIFPGKALLRALNPFHWQKEMVAEAIRFMKALRSRHFDLAIDVQGLLKSSALARFSRAPVRVGFKGAREFADRFMTHLVDVGDYFGPDRHVVDLNLMLAKKAIELLGGKPEECQPVEFSMPKPDEQTWLKVKQLVENGLSPAPNMLPDEKYEKAPNLLSRTPGSAAPDLGPDSGSRGDNKVLSSPGSPPAPDSYRLDKDSGLPPETESSAGSISIVSRPGPKAKATLLGENTKTKEVKAPLAVLIPSTTWVSKIWPASQWADLAQELMRVANYRIFIVGGRADVQANQMIEIDLLAGTRGGVLNLTGKTSILDLIALFNMVDLVIGADTGPLHIAAATGRPKVIGIFGSTPTRRNGPYGSNCASVSLQLSCQPCFAKICPLGTTACLKDMSYQYVFEKISALLPSLKNGPQKPSI